MSTVDDLVDQSLKQTVAELALTPSERQLKVEESKAKGEILRTVGAGAKLMVQDRASDSVTASVVNIATVSNALRKEAKLRNKKSRKGKKRSAKLYRQDDAVIRNAMHSALSSLTMLNKSAERIVTPQES